MRRAQFVLASGRLEQACELLYHRAAQLLRIHDGHCPTVIAGHVVPNADRGQLDGRATLDPFDDLLFIALSMQCTYCAQGRYTGDGGGAPSRRRETTQAQGEGSTVLMLTFRVGSSVSYNICCKPLSCLLIFSCVIFCTVYICLFTHTMLQHRITPPYGSISFDTKHIRRLRRMYLHPYGHNANRGLHIMIAYMRFCGCFYIMMTRVANIA